MAWYRTGTIAAAKGSKTVTGTGTKWADNKQGIGAGQMLLVPGSGSVQAYEIASVKSDTELTLTDAVASEISGSAYAILAFYGNSYPDFARQLAAQLKYYQSQMDGWQEIMTGTGDVTLVAPDGTSVTISSLSKLTEEITGKLDKTGGNVSGSLTAKSLRAVGGTFGVSDTEAKQIFDFHVSGTDMVLARSNGGNLNLDGTPLSGLGQLSFVSTAAAHQSLLSMGVALNEGNRLLIPVSATQAFMMITMTTVTTQNASGDSTITFPQAFSSIINVVPSNGDAAVFDGSVQILNSIRESGFDVRAYNISGTPQTGAIRLNYIAMGVVNI